MRNQAEFALKVSDNQQQLFAQLGSRYDFIVCGAGTSGSVVAGRLAENSEVSVLLLEAGGSDHLETVMDPNQWVRNLGGPLDWGFLTRANPNLNGRSILYSMGKVLGGGSSINVSTWSRAHQVDWDYYASEAGDDAWGYRSVLDLYRRRVEDWTGEPDPEYRGTGGPVHLQPAANPHPFSLAMLEAAESTGLRRFANSGGKMMEADGGCGIIDEIVHDGKRKSLFRSYTYPRMDQSNLTVLTGALVTRIVFTGRRATGVELQHDGKELRIEAATEVILALGAIQTPKVLMQSGIGDEIELAKFDIPLIQHLPGVGRNLHDHVALGCVWEGTELPFPTVPRSQAVAFWKTDPKFDAPNFFTYVRGGSSVSAENQAEYPTPALSWSLSTGMRPMSRGAIHLTGARASDPLLVDANYLHDPEDLKELMRGIARARDIGNSSAMKPYVKREVAPGHLDSARLERFIRNGLGTFWHQSCTAKMGSDAMAVVNHKLKVYGTEGLRVADASILPRVTTGNTMAPCVVIGERAAAILQDQHRV